MFNIKIVIFNNCLSIRFKQEHHLQRAICTGLIIPTPEVFEATDSEFYERYYSQDYKMPKQLIHMQRKNFQRFVGSQV